MHIGGSVAPGFEGVRRAFERNLTELGDLGAAVAAFHGGVPVVDLYGGSVDASGDVPWDARTIVMTYSTTKPLTAACLVLLADRGRLDLDIRVAEHWPEFAAHGKEWLTMRGLLTHQAGLLTLDAEVATETLYDWDAVISLLARQAPMWEPGTKHGEHAYFYGHLVGEVVRRIDGRSLGRFFAEEIAQPWGLDFHIGVSDRDIDRVAPLVFSPGWAVEVSGAPGSLYNRALNNPPGMLDEEIVNGREWLQAEIPAVNGVGTAMAVARFYQGLSRGGELDGARVFSPEACREMFAVHSSGPDVLLERDLDWGLGVQIDEDGIGHGGLGGSAGLYSPDLDVTFGYVTNLMSDAPRADALWEALVASIEHPADREE